MYKIEKDEKKLVRGLIYMDSVHGEEQVTEKSEESLVKGLIYIDSICEEEQIVESDMMDEDEAVRMREEADGYHGFFCQNEEKPLVRGLIYMDSVHGEEQVTEKSEESLVKGLIYMDSICEEEQIVESDMMDEDEAMRMREEADGYHGFFRCDEEKPLVRGITYDEEELTPEVVDHQNVVTLTYPDVTSNNIPMAECFRNPFINEKASIFEPVPKDDEEFTVKKSPDIEDIVKGIIATGRICSFKKNLFCWSEHPAYYRKLVDNEAQVLIHRFCVEKFPKYFPISFVVEEVRRCLLFNSSITVSEKMPLPPEVWPFADGLVNIRTGVMCGDSRGFFYTEALAADYDPEAVCPTFDHFLATCMGYDEKLVEMLWRVVGYILSSDTRAKKFFVFLGPKDSGKSLLANVIASLLDENSVSAMSINEFGAKFAVSELVDKHLALCMDLSNETISQAAVGMVKAITGGDKIRTEAKFQSGVTTPIVAKILFGSNHPLQVKEADSAFSDRQIAIPFKNPVPKEKQDRWLLEKIKKEIPGITIKAAAAYLRLVDNAYEFGETKNVGMLPVEVDHLAVVKKFAEVCCDFSDDKAKSSTEELFKNYSGFVLEYGLPATDKSTFSQLFKEATGLEKKKLSIRGISLQGYLGVKIKA